MSCSVTSVFTFKIESTFDEWDPEGNVQKFVEANGDWMATHRVDLSTMEESSWTSSPKD